MVPSTGADLLASKTESISDSLFDATDISRNLNKLFDPLVEITPGKSPEGKDIQLTSLRGVPLGYETMAAYYNRAVLESAVPATWEEFETTLKNGEQPPVAL